ncbi:MAG: MerR family transcriptional regulator [Candidatus Tectomicrobia bacterium]|uniref:MerR family transcriptional regulator n=1 Tax=Tectimicrobiota bacterium TaxID=2528274 RepID=A0A937VXW1_UNCTE|nr:MerR family transcriptional regulator [Candidatus Tectomicrobia bacterium]
MSSKRGKEYFTISAVSNMFDIHPQTLRLYEREGLLRPERSSGNTRLYSRQDIEHLSTILNLTREMGVNLAGVTIIMDLLHKLREVQEEKHTLLAMREALEARLAASPPYHTTSV